MPVFSHARRKVRRQWLWICVSYGHCHEVRKSQMRFRFAAIAFMFATSSVGSAAESPDPADRYSRAHEAYLDSQCPLPANSIKHFVYLARDRQRLRGHAFLENERFSGAQIMYAWAQLETTKGHYDFSIIEEDLNYLSSRKRRLFIQLQDATFSTEYKGVPAYLLSDEYDGGAVMQRGDNGDEGWAAKRWNAAVRARFAALLMALGEKFDGRIEGINLQETAIGVTNEQDGSFTPEKYATAIKTNLLALKKAFPRSTTMQYANFMPGEWLPWEDKGYLRSIYAFAEQIGVGVGAPDLMVRRKGQLNHALAVMHENEYSVPVGIAVQDGNYIGQTNSAKVVSPRRNLVPLLHAFAQDFLRVDYMFWVDQSPYFEEDVLPCFESKEELAEAQSLKPGTTQPH
jgi:hypothetical protein